MAPKTAAPKSRSKTSNATTPRKTKAAPKSLLGKGARCVSIFGPFNSKALVEMSVDLAAQLFGEVPLFQAGDARVVDAVQRDIDDLAKRDEGLAQSALAATAMQMAYELQNPYNSATSKAQCAKSLREALADLREMAPPAVLKDGVDDLSTHRAKRRERSAVAAD